MYVALVKMTKIQKLINRDERSYQLGHNYDKLFTIIRKDYITMKRDAEDRSSWQWSMS